MLYLIISTLFFLLLQSVLTIFILSKNKNRSNLILIYFIAIKAFNSFIFWMSRTFFFGGIGYDQKYLFLTLAIPDMTSAILVNILIYLYGLSIFGVALNKGSIYPHLPPVIAILFSTSAHLYLYTNYGFFWDQLGRINAILTSIHLIVYLGVLKIFIFPLTKKSPDRNLKWFSKIINYLLARTIILYSFFFIVSHFIDMSFESIIEGNQSFLSNLSFFELFETIIIILFLSYHSIINSISQTTHRSKSNYMKVIPLDKKDIILKTFINTVKNNKLYLDSEIKISTIANYIGVHKNTLSQVINSEFGIRFTDYINRLRIDDVIRNMKNPDKTNFLHIALNSGFNSKASFNRAFRRYKGVSPTEYKKNLINCP